jgi:[histone H3]-trimethyl-L-lysine9/36 demethylase
MWKAYFAWHVEDMNLNVNFFKNKKKSINYLHFGKPKRWYCIPPSYSEEFEKITKNELTNESNVCKEFLRHKTTMIGKYFE